MAEFLYISILPGLSGIRGHPMGLLEGFVVVVLLRCLKHIPAIEVALGRGEYARNKHEQRYPKPKPLTRAAYWGSRLGIVCQIKRSSRTAQVPARPPPP